jgi:acyl dehydratase
VGDELSRGYDDVRLGERLPPFTVPLTLQRLAMEAAANRDFAPWHLDPAAARGSGAPAVFANTTFIETLLEAGIRSWCGSDARIRTLDFALKDFNCVGDVVSAAGEVTAKDGERVVELAVWLESGRGRTVEGSARLVFAR